MLPRPTSGRLPIDPTTLLPTIDSFGGLSDFLRTAIADEQSVAFSESMAELARHFEAVIEGLRQSRRRAHAAPLLMDMLLVLRGHRAVVLDLGLAWRGLFEYAAYLQALNNFRILIGQWLLESAPWDDELDVTAADFELVAWRTMGEGMLLIDMYEQWLEREQEQSAAGRSDLGDLRPNHVSRVLQWWHKLRR